MCLAVLPIVVQMVRAGLSGWIPAKDAAPTAPRAKFALGFPPTLVGMYTDASTWIGVPTYFPGAWQLYWMALPIRVLGSTWGTLVAMAVLNVCWVCLAGWFVRRRLGDRAAIGALALVAVLMFALTPALLVSPVPMVMVLPPFAAFCFGDSGNIGNLIRAGGAQPAAKMSYWDGLQRWLELFMFPDFSLRASREHSALATRGASLSTTAVIVAGAVLVVAVTPGRMPAT